MPPYRYPQQGSVATDPAKERKLDLAGFEPAASPLRTGRSTAELKALRKAAERSNIKSRCNPYARKRIQNRGSCSSIPPAEVKRSLTLQLTQLVESSEASALQQADKDIILMRGRGFEPLKALSHTTLNRARLAAPASARIENEKSSGLKGFS